MALTGPHLETEREKRKMFRLAGEIRDPNSTLMIYQIFKFQDLMSIYKWDTNPMFKLLKVFGKVSADDKCNICFLKKSGWDETVRFVESVHNRTKMWSLL